MASRCRLQLVIIIIHSGSAMHHSIAVSGEVHLHAHYHTPGPSGKPFLCHPSPEPAKRVIAVSSPGVHRLRATARRFRPHAVWISSRKAGFRPGKARISFPVGQRTPSLHSLGNETLWLHTRTTLSATHSAPLRGSGVFLFVTQGFATAWLHPGLTAAALRAQNHSEQRMLRSFTEAPAGAKFR